MQKCIKSKSNGIQNKKLFFKTFSLIIKAATCLLIIVLVSEIFIGFLQTGTLIAWQHAVNEAEHFLNHREDCLFLIFAFLLSFISYIAMDLFRMILESLYTLLNSQLSEFFQSKLHDKCRTINAIYFEDSELYNEIDRANKSIDGIVSLVGIVGVFLMAISRIVTLGTYVLFIKPLLALIVVLPIIPILITRVIRGRDLYRLNYVQSGERRECNYYHKCILKKETKTLLATSFFFKKWDYLYCKINKEEARVNRKISIVFTLMNVLKYSIYVIAIIIATAYMCNGSIDVGTFALIASMLGTTHATIEVVVSKTGDVSWNLRQIKDYFLFLEKSDDVISAPKQFERFIELNNVSFVYPNSNNNVLHNINLSIKRGEKIALVGENGAGKTTLAKIVLGIYNPTSGEILLDGKCKDNNTLIDGSVVFQDFCKYFFTLRENVAFGNISLIDEDEKLKFELSEFDFEIEKIGSSLDIQLGRDFDGIELSGGEWQKIALARGFIKNSDFIILDEPNSGLDPLAESKMVRRLLKMLADYTGIIITHRIGIATLADRIIVLENGEIVEEGAHDELLKKDGKYQLMFNTQANIYK